MGTGIVSILLHNLPYNGIWLYWISITMFVLNAFLFVLFVVISIFKYLLYPGIWGIMIRHPALPLFLGACPIGLATVVEMIVLVCVPAWGYWAVMLAWGLWWVDAAASIAVCYLVPFVIMHVHDPTLPEVTAAWLLPIAPPVVASGLGGVIAEALVGVNERYALWTLIVSYILWGTAIPLSMTCLVVYFHRLMMHRLPPREVIVSVFLPVAPLGQGAFAILQFGKVAGKLFPETGSLGSIASRPGDALYVVGWLTCLIMWAYGLAWLCFALASIICCGPFPFNMTWWSFVFPLGVWASATISLGQELPSKFFNVLGTVVSVIVVLLWLVVATCTMRKVISGEIFVAPDFTLWQENNMKSEVGNRV